MADETLDWMFELDGNTSGADRLLRTLDRLDKTMAGLDAKTHDVDKATRMAGEGHRKHAQEAGLLDTALGHVTKQFGHIVKLVAEWDAAEFLIKMPLRIFAIGEEMIGVAAKAERTGKAFGLLFGSEEGKANLEYIEQIGKYTEFTHEQIKAAVLDLGKVGFKGEGLDRALAAAHDMAAFSANPQEGFGSALASLERIKRTGRVDNRVLGGVGIGQKDFFAELSIRTGKSADSLKSAMDKGTLNTEDAIETLYTMIAKKTGKDLGGAAVDMSKSMTAMLTHARELPDRYFEKLADTPGFGKFKDQIGHLFEQLDPDSPSGGRIFASLEDAFNGFSEQIGDMDIAGILKTIAADIPPVIGALRDVAHVVYEIVHGFAVAAGAVKDFLGAVGDLGEKSGVAGKFRSMTTAMEKNDVTWMNPATGLVETHKSGWAVPGGAPNPSPAGMSMAPDANMSGGWESTGEDAGAKLEKGFRKKTRTHSPSDAFKDIGQDLADGLGEGMSAGYSASASPRLGSAGGVGGRGSVHMTITVPVAVGAHGGDAASQAEAIAERLRAILPGQLQSAFEQIAMEGGG